MWRSYVLAAVKETGYGERFSLLLMVRATKVWRFLCSHYSVVFGTYMHDHYTSPAPRAHPRIALGYFSLKALLLYPPHVVVMRLHDAMLATLLSSYRKSMVNSSATGGPLSYGRLFFTPVVGNLSRSNVVILKPLTAGTVGV